jgi:di/tricarboxylate transporter
MKKSWAEIVTCVAFLGVVVFGVFLTHLLVQAASGIVNPYVTVMFHPTIAWITLALLYNLALVTVAFVAATVGGIAALDLYTSAKTAQMPGSVDPEPHS